MADKQISDLTSASAMTDGSLFVIEQGGAAKSANWGMIKNYISPGVAPQYSSSATYNLGDYAIYNEQLYRCTTAITTAETWTAAHWEQVSVGDVLSGLGESIVLDRFNNSSLFTEAKTDSIDRGKYYSTATGEKAVGASYCCSKNLIPVSEVTGSFWVADAQTNALVIIACYDSNKNYLGYCLAPPSSMQSALSCVKKDTAYIGLTVNTSSINHIGIYRRKKVTAIEYPFTDTYVYINHWVNDSGTVSGASTIDCAYIPEVFQGDTFYVNGGSSVSMVFFDANGTFISYAYDSTVVYNGKIFVAPANTAYALLNIVHAYTHGANEYSTVCYKITKSETVLCIGDSLTYLDGHTINDDNAPLFLGYQKVIEKAGYKVVSAGFSGYTYAKGATSGGTPVGSIYTQIVENQYDVSGYDYIVLMAGTNDDLFNVPVGSVPTEYTHTYTASELETTIGALGGILQYIRANNDTAKIILCTEPKSEAILRKYSEAKLYWEGMREMSDYGSCYLCDIFRNINVFPNTDGFAEFFYDNTHPNKKGMERVGKLILESIYNS